MPDRVAAIVARASAFHAACAALEREVSPGIVVRPGKLSGAAHIKGTRLRAEDIARMFFEGRSMAQVVELYPDLLTLTDVENAARWVSRGRPGETPEVRKRRLADERAARRRRQVR